jgi:GDP-mannose 6-dehydrogenase
MATSISIFGLGYVGSVTAACLAHQGHRVIGVDLNPLKVNLLRSGRSPVLEAGLEDLISEGQRSSLLEATSDTKRAVLDSDFSFISVGTPSLANGKLNLQSVQNVCREIGESLRQKSSFHWIVLRSTVLPGTTDSVVIPILECASGKRAGMDFGVCFNPEFLREGSAISDFLQPPFTILGAANGTHFGALRNLYSSVPGQTYETTTTTAEMVKYVCNAFHALKVSFANEIGTLCNRLGADVDMVVEIFTSDKKLNVSPAYLRPGFAFGGSCLPKDLRALTYRARELDLKLPLLESILPSNVEHIDRALEEILQTNKRKIGILGLSFKSGTDDLRESPMVHLVKRLVGEGCQCRIWDRNVVLGQLIGSNRQFIENTIPHIGALLCDDLDGVLKSADVILLGTRELEKERVLAQLHSDQILVDLVGLQRPQSGKQDVISVPLAAPVRE